MAENQPDDDPKTEIDDAIERLKRKRQAVPEAASRGRFMGAGIIMAIVVFLVASLFWQMPEPTPALPTARVELPPIPPVTPTEPHPRQYEESIGPPVPPIIPRAVERRPGEKARIALVIDDCGISNAQTGPVLDLPKEVTLAFLPYGYATQNMASRAHTSGHDVMLHMPMQPLGHNDPGPTPVTPGLPAEEIQQRVSNALELVPHAIGVNNHMGSAATADAPAMQAVMTALKDKNVFFLDSYTNSRSVAYRTSLAHGLQTARRDVFLDDTISAEAIAYQLERLEKIAHKQGYAVAIGHPHPATMEALKNWLPSLSDRGLELVRVKDLTRGIE